MSEKNGETNELVDLTPVEGTIASAPTSDYPKRQIAQNASFEALENTGNGWQIAREPAVVSESAVGGRRQRRSQKKGGRKSKKCSGGKKSKKQQKGGKRKSQKSPKRGGKKQQKQRPGSAQLEKDY